MPDAPSNQLAPPSVHLWETVKPRCCHDAAPTGTRPHLRPVGMTANGGDNDSKRQAFEPPRTMQGCRPKRKATPTTKVACRDIAGAGLHQCVWHGHRRTPRDLGLSRWTTRQPGVVRPGSRTGRPRWPTGRAFSMREDKDFDLLRQRIEAQFPGKKQIPESVSVGRQPVLRNYGEQPEDVFEVSDRALHFPPFGCCPWPAILSGQNAARQSSDLAGTVRWLGHPFTSRFDATLHVASWLERHARHLSPWRSTSPASPNISTFERISQTVGQRKGCNGPLKRWTPWGGWIGPLASERA